MAHFGGARLSAAAIGDGGAPDNNPNNGTDDVNAAGLNQITTAAAVNTTGPRDNHFARRMVLDSRTSSSSFSESDGAMMMATMTTTPSSPSGTRTMQHLHPMIPASPVISTAAAAAKEQLDTCSAWLLSIPAEEARAIQHTREYRDFIRAMEGLHAAQRKVRLWNAQHQQSASLAAVSASKTQSAAPTEFSTQTHLQQQQQSLVNEISQGSSDPTSLSSIDHLKTAIDPAIIMNSNDSNASTSSASDDAALLNMKDLAEASESTLFSFLQHMAADDIILRIFDFLDCQNLIRALKTCTRFRELALRNARQRTQRMAMERQLNNVMQLLRAKEQVDGIGTDIRDCHVRVPTLLLSRRVRVTDAGDPEYNGVYYCTGSNGNGFVFTKPRYPEHRVERSLFHRAGGADDAGGRTDHLGGGGNAATVGRAGGRNLPDEVFLDSSSLESEVAQPGSLLRCIIAKRFSNETLLWYCSKEVIATEDSGEVRVGDVTQVFSFWAKLMVIGDASPDICRYPSQSSILARHEEGWQTLSTTRAVHPPTVELLD